MGKLNIKQNIILGSKSPRRIELLKLMNLNFKVKKLNVDESYPKTLSPIQTALFLSKKKSKAYKINHNEILICADTIVYTKKSILGKPKFKNEAKEMLKQISNKRHSVVTAVTIRTGQKEISFYEKSTVYFKSLSDEEVEFYINNYNPLDKAGGYGIQDWIGVVGICKISGSFYNVMGLPTAKLYDKLKELTCD